MTAALDALVDILDLEEIEENIFRGRSPDVETQRVFGGQVAGQALVAAGRTVPADRPVHSLHAYFLRPGDPQVPIVYEVDRIRDGRSFTTRRVVAIQHGAAIFNLAVSFHRDEPGIDHQVPMPAAPDPETLPTFHERLAPIADRLPPFWARPQPIDVRHVQAPWMLRDAPREPRQMVWMRADGELPDDPLVHVCAMTYASDLTLLDSVLLAHGLGWHVVRGASLDHAMWFHRPFRFDGWLLYAQESPTAAGARGLARGLLFARDGRLVASVVQEGLLRVVERSSGARGDPPKD
jgi:acyl-CoA thioesterase-2